MSQDAEKHRRWIREGENGRSASIYFLGKGIIKELGEEKGTALIVRQIEEMGYSQGKARRKADESQGLVSGLKSFARKVDSGDTVYSFAWVGAINKSADDERVVEYSYCPIAEGY